MLHYIVGLFGYTMVTIESQTPPKEPKPYRQTQAALAARTKEQVLFEEYVKTQKHLKDRSRRWYISDYDDIIMAWCFEAFKAGLTAPRRS